MDRNKRIYLATQIVLLAVFLAIIIFASLKYAPSVTRLFREPDKFREFLSSYGAACPLVYIAFSAIQVIVAVIPGEIVQVAGGYAFGTLLGTIYAMAGTIIGTVVVFAAIRLLGFALVKAMISPAQLERFRFLISSPKSEIAIFVLFLIPGIPKDVLVYLSGLTPISMLRFLIICTIARLPGVLGSAYIGANLQQKDFHVVYIMFGISLILFIAGVLMRDKIIDRLQRWRRAKDDTPSSP
jgi:uncharacterized membrane protein YdjX (TVP38/TMEM64 family)